MSYFRSSNPTLMIVSKGWQVVEPVIYYSESLGAEIVVPSGFFTDLASVPKIARILVPVANAKNRPAAIVHDYLCYKEVQEKYGIDQRMADRIFREALAVCNVNPIGQWGMWLPVRIYQWWKNR